MKKVIILILALSAFLLSGCSKKDQMVSFIPTPTPIEETEEIAKIPEKGTEDEDNNSEDSDKEDSELETVDEAIVIGETITKYVKLKEYNDYLNVRSKPSMEGKVIGFLLHAEKIEVIKIEDGWACFVRNGEYRYVSANYLVDERPEYLEPPTPTPSPKPTPSPTPEVSSEPTPTSTPEEETPPPEI